MAARVSLPAWVVPTIDAVDECERVARRVVNARSYELMVRERGVAAALLWLTLGEVSPMTRRVAGASIRGGRFSGPECEAVETWTCGVTREDARAEAWVALSVAAGQHLPTEDDWTLLGVVPALPRIDDREFAYGVWRTLSWLLGVRDDFPIYTSWHRSAGVRHERPHLARRRQSAEEPSGPDRVADQAARDQAEADAFRWWSYVRQRLDATAAGASRYLADDV
ncbi:MAG: hypothetical protein AB7I38_18930 [Dehalococcoidia bacterium]